MWPPDAVYVGRPSPFGNPFSLEPGQLRSDVIRKYEEWVRTRPLLIRKIKAELKGRDLLCWCAPLPCHADVLLRIANEEESMKTEFPVLYKKNTKGTLQEWKIEVEGTTIRTVHGQVDGKKQTTEDVIKAGKNVGKVNATTPEQQAIAEAKARWEKQLRIKLYVEDPEKATAGEADERFVEGGISPMLAHKFADHGHKIKYPCLVSKKLDGMRLVATINDGVCKLWTRNRKPVTSLPHINRAFEEKFPEGTHVFDGEAYVHTLAADFERIMSLCRSKKPGEGHEVIEYHVFDAVLEGVPFVKRYKYLKELFADAPHPFKLVKNKKADSEDELVEIFTSYLRQGYEGAMVRNAEGMYEYKRSYDLLKVKEFLDEEFPIVDFEEGRGKLMGHVASFICRTPEGKTFKAKMDGSLDRLKAFFEDHSLWQGKILTVCYQNKTKDSVPRFPVGKRFREEE